MRPELPKLTKAQEERAAEKAVELHNMLTRIMLCVCHSDAESAADFDPFVFSDAFALLGYITSGEE